MWSRPEPELKLFTNPSPAAWECWHALAKQFKNMHGNYRIESHYPTHQAS
jgi:hypothetical protein